MRLKTLKCNIKSILYRNCDYSFLFDVIERANNVSFVGYYFVRAFILYKYEKNEIIPKLDKEFMMTAIRTISKKGAGPKSKNSNDLRIEMSTFFDEYFVKHFYENYIKDDDVNNYKLHVKNLSYILSSVADEMVVAYSNNIKYNYEKYVRQFTNQSFEKEHKEIINNCKKEDRYSMRNKLNSELTKIKNDLFDNTRESDKKYHMWIDTYRKLIIPEHDNDLEHDLTERPHKFLKCMLYMNKYLEDNGLKKFQPLPLRTEVKDMYITLNTHALVDITPTINHKNEYFKDIPKHQYDLWNDTFNFNKMKIKGHSFNYQIQTDGKAVSINFIKNEDVVKKREKINRIVNASKKAKKEYKNLSTEDIEKIKADKIKETEEKELENKKKVKELQSKMKKEFKKLSKEEQEEINLKRRLEKDEFKDIEDLIKNKKFLEELKKCYENNEIGYNDPGMNNIATILRNDGRIYTYRTRRRIKETRRNKFNKLIDNKKKNVTLENGKTVKENEAYLSEHCGKSMNLDKFIKFGKLKNILRNMVVKQKDYNEYLKKLNWHAYINKKRHTDKIMNEIEEFIGKKGTIVVGNWNGKGKISHISTPGIGFKRKLKERFNVIHLNEYNTSIINHETKERMKNLEIEVTYYDKEKEEKVKEKRSLHSVFTYKTSSGRLGCINRDRNAVYNYKVIVESLLKGEGRPKEYIQKPQKQNQKPDNQFAECLEAIGSQQFQKIILKDKKKEVSKKPKKKFITVKKNW